MSKLTPARIQTLATKKGVKTVAVQNFLGTLGTMSKADALMNLSQDARSYKWNAATQAAIRTGINEAGLP